MSNKVEREYGILPIDTKHAPPFDDDMTVFEVFGYAEDVYTSYSSYQIHAKEKQDMLDEIGEIEANDYDDESKVHLVINAKQDGNPRSFLYLVSVRLDETRDLVDMLNFLY